MVETTHLEAKYLLLGKLKALLERLFGNNYKVQVSAIYKPGAPQVRASVC